MKTCTAIHLKDKELGKYKSIGDKSETLDSLSRINILIGRNNSGKSRFLRQLYSDSKLEYQTTQINLTNFNNGIFDIQEQLDDLLPRHQVQSVTELTENLKAVQFVSSESNVHNQIQNLNNAVRLGGRRNIQMKRGYQMNSPSQFEQILNRQLGDRVNSLPDISESDIANSFRKTIYIPTLRGLRGFSTDNANTSDQYRDRTIRDYFDQEETEKDSIYTGLSFYHDVKRLLLGPTEGRTRIRKFEDFLSKSFFEDDDVNIIPNIEDTVVHVKIGDKEEHPIYELGDGIQAIIILTYPLFFRQGEPLNICIEEPDLFLHPGFQRVFIQTLSDPKFKSFQFFFTTHSNHFLDMTLDFKDISVYCFSKLDQDQFEIENVSNANDKVLEEIGVRNSSVFLSNCTIWVEGITDRIYIRKYLKLYIKSHKAKPVMEDVHFSYVEYSGGNITHWSFLDDDDEEHPTINVERLCGRIFLIADRDKTDLSSSGKDKKSLRIKKLQEVLGERFYCIKRREIENLLTENVRLETVRKLEKPDAELELISVKGISVDKTPIGTWIHKKVSGINRTYEAKSGTVKDKVAFAKAAVSCINSFDDLSDEAKELSEIIHKFILDQNK